MFNLNVSQKAVHNTQYTTHYTVKQNTRLLNERFDKILCFISMQRGVDGQFLLKII